ncbi:hypothetical protein ACHAXT_009456 [Thalassiosira profunda]
MDRSGGQRSARASGTSPPRQSKRKGKQSKSSAQPATVDDAPEAKAPSKKKKGKGSSSLAADDALEAKIRRKNAAAASSGGQHQYDSARAGREEEKVEEGLSVSHDDAPDERIARTNAAAPATGQGEPSFARGGGDVRNRPPPSLSQHQRNIGQQPSVDPLRQAELNKKQNRGEVNQKFKDVHETGRWGGLTKWEKYGICLLTVGAIVAAIVLGVQFGRGDGAPEPTGGPTGSPTEGPSASPTMAPTDVTYREAEGLERMRAVSGEGALPATPGEVAGAKARGDSTPQEIAAEYVLYDDLLELPARDPRFMERYALVVFYFANGGCAEDWVSTANWMNDADHCGGTDELGTRFEPWHGVVCDLKGRVVELNLGKNYVTGTLPAEFGALLELSALDLSNNAMDGFISARALGVPKLYTLQLNNNQFTGEFPFEELKDRAPNLDVLWIQENTGLTGSLGTLRAYCPMSSITLDCDNIGPKPTYPDDSGVTQFEMFCEESVGRGPTEFTCNFDFEPFAKPEGGDGGLFAPSPEICGTPSRA